MTEGVIQRISAWKRLLMKWAFSCGMWREYYHHPFIDLWILVPCCWGLLICTVYNMNTRREEYDLRIQVKQTNMYFNSSWSGYWHHYAESVHMMQDVVLVVNEQLNMTTRIKWYADNGNMICEIRSSRLNVGRKCVAEHGTVWKGMMWISVAYLFRSY